ncbi:MAG: hypothetical protein ACPLEW_11045 [Pseudothermotoga sp.]
MKINKIRRALYKTQRVLGDIEAVSKGPKAVAKRIARRTVGRVFAKTMRKIFK